MSSFISEIVHKYMFNLHEKVADKVKKEKQSSNTNGVLHELLVGYFLKDGQHMTQHPNVIGETPEQAHDRLKDEIIKKQGQAKYDDMVAKARDMANQYRAQLGGKPIRDVHWTSKAGDVERVTGVPVDQDHDASDIYVEHGDNDFTGLSLKTVDKKNAKAPVGNPGHGKLDSMLGTNTARHFEAARDNLRKEHPEFAALKTAKEASNVLKANANLAKAEKAARAEAMANIAREHHAAMSNMTQQQLWDHIQHVTRAHQTQFPHLRVTSSGSNGNFAHKFENPYEEHINSWGKRPTGKSKDGDIKVELKKGTIHIINTKTGAHIKQRYKAAGSEGVFGSIKASIE